MRIFEHIALCCVGQKGIVPFLFLTKHPSKDVVSQLRKVVWVRFRGFLPCSWDGREGETLSSAPILGELLCSPGYPWRAAEVNCAAIVGMQDQGASHTAWLVWCIPGQLWKNQLNVTHAMLSQSC